MKTPVSVTVTGAAGQIGYSLLFRIANGDMLGNDQPVILRLLEMPQAMPALRGVAMELDDCAFPLLAKIEMTEDPNIAFEEADIALLVGARPRGKGMERKDLLEANGKIFTVQGKAINDFAKPNVKVLAVGNPANTNAYITMKSAPNISSRNFTAMMRLDHNRALSKLAEKTGVSVTEIENLVIWGNHSPTMYPDYRFSKIRGAPGAQVVDDENWYVNTFMPEVGKRGAAIISARGLSSAASAANAAIDHMRDWVLGSDKKWVTMGVPSNGEYGIPKGLIFGFPCVCENGDYQIVNGLKIDSFSQSRINLTLKELEEEEAAIKDMLG